MRPAGHQPGEMRHVDHQIGADTVGNGAEAGEIDDPRIGAAAGDDEFRPVRLGLPRHLVEVDAPVLGAHAVLRGLEPFARDVGARAMGQVPAGGQRHAEDRVARLEQRQIHRLVGRGAGMRLNIGEAAIEQRLGPLDRQAFGNVDKLAATVIAPTGIALGVFIGQHRALRLEHPARDDILAGDQLYLRLLAVQLAGDGFRQFGVRVSKTGGKETGFRCGIGD